MPHIIISSTRRFFLTNRHIVIIRPTFVALIAASLLLTACDASRPAEIEPETKTERETETEPEPETERETVTEPEPETETEIETEVEPPCFIPDEVTYGSLDLRDSNLTIALAADLNSDGRLEVLVPKRSTCRDFAVCPTDVLRTCEGGGYEVVAELTYFFPGAIIAGPDSTRGWLDLHASTATRDDEGLWETTPVRFVWDGETYVRGEVEK